MKFKAEKTDLLNGIHSVQNIITSKATLPILSNILIEAESKNIRFTATDLDIGITCVLPVDIQEPGAITIPAKRFSDIIKELPEGDVVIQTKKNNQVSIEAGPCLFKVVGVPREEFPKLPEFKDKQAIKIEQPALARMLRLTSFAVSYDEFRYTLNGILFRINKSKLDLVATDGKRLAAIKKDLKEAADKDLSFIVPIKAIQELNRNLKTEGDLSLILGNNQVLFDLGGVAIISRLIEGDFPDYSKVLKDIETDISASPNNKLKVGREEFLVAIKRAALLSTPDYQAVKFELFKNKVVVSKSTPDVGESREELAAEYPGKEMVIGFDPAYLMDALKNLSDDNVQLELIDSEKPGVIRTEGYAYIVSAMRLG